MPVNIISTTYSDEFNTGTSLNLNANVSDVITATHNVYFENTVDAEADASYRIDTYLTDNMPPQLQFTGYDSSQGYDIMIFNASLSLAIPDEQITELVGKTITTLGFAGVNVTATVLAVEIDTGQGHKVVLDSTTGLGNGNKGIFYVDELIESCSIDFAFFGNSNNNTYTPALELDEGIGVRPNFSTLTSVLDANSATVINIPFKTNGAYQTGSLTIQGKGITTDASNSIYNRQAFEIIHVTQATPISIYSSGSEFEPVDAELPNRQLQLSSLFSSTNQGRYKLNINLLTNPSDTVPSTIELDNSSVRVSAFNNKFLGGGTNYSFTNLAIIRTSDSEVSGVPIVQEKFTVSFDVENTDDSPFVDLNTKVKVGIESIPESWENDEDYIQTFLSDSVIATLGDAAAAGTATGDAASITNYTSTYNSGTSISCSFDVEYNANAIAQINNNDVAFFSIYVETQNHTLNYTNSDRVVLQPFVGAGIQKLLLNPITVNNTQFITSPYDDFSTGINASDIDGFPVQLLTASTQFNADWTNRTNLRIDTISQQLVLKNTSTLEELELDETIIPVNSFVLIDGEYPDANYSVLKGFKIPEDEVRNKIEMINISDVSSVRTFEVFFPFFIRWEYYTQLILDNIPSSILDSNEPFNGVNYDVNRIDDLANWELDYRVTFNCEEDGQLFEQDFDYTVPTSGYNSHPDVLSRVVNSYSEDGLTLLEEAGEKFIESTERTLIVGEWELNYTPSAIGDFEIEFYIEAFENGSPTKIQRISSTNDLLSSSWFSSTDGSGLVVKTISGDKCIGTVYIDNTKLVKYDYYNVYGTFYNPKRPDEYILTEGGDNLVTEGGDKIIKDF
jgi:hypothetical protein